MPNSLPYGQLVGYTERRGTDMNPGFREAWIQFQVCDLLVVSLWGSYSTPSGIGGWLRQTGVMAPFRQQNSLVGHQHSVLTQRVSTVLSLLPDHQVLFTSTPTSDLCGKETVLTSHSWSKVLGEFWGNTVESIHIHSRPFLPLPP